MNIKICHKCGKRKFLESFYLRKTGSRTGQHYEKCKQCMKLRGRTYYHTNRKRQLSLALLRKAKYRLIIKNYFIKYKNKSCQDCGQKYPDYVMDFDHRDRKAKIMSVSRMVAGGWSFDKIQQEIEKCDLVCANCHRIRTYGKYAEVAKVVTAGV